MFIMSRPSTSVFIVDDEAAQQVIAKLHANPGIKKVVLAQYWEYCLNEKRVFNYSRLEEFAIRIRNMDRKLYILTDIPVYDFNPTEVIGKQRIVSLFRDRAPKCLQSIAQYESRQGEINRKLAILCNRTGTDLVPMHFALKRDARYISIDDVDGETVSLYNDNNHLSLEGSLLVAKFIYPYIFDESIKTMAEIE